MFKLLTPFLLLALLAPAIAGTKLTTTWKDPNFTKTNFAKIVVAYISKDADLRRRVEGGLARRIQRSVASNTLLPEDAPKDREAVRAVLSSNGVDALIVVRLVDYTSDKNYSMGQSWEVPDLWDGWTTGWTTVNTSSYVRDEKVVIAEITLYAVATGKPVWAGRLKETSAMNLRVLLDNLVKAGSEELRKQKLI